MMFVHSALMFWLIRAIAANDTVQQRDPTTRIPATVYKMRPSGRAVLCELLLPGAACRAAGTQNKPRLSGG
jgi:hypothetical protein